MSWPSEYLLANWFTLVQSIGIVATLLIAIATLRRQMHQTRVANSLLVTQHHRDIWKMSIENSKLNRTFTKKPDLFRKPITEAERTFVNLIFLHMCATLKAIEAKTIYPIDGMVADLVDIMSFPIPALVWREVAPYHDKIFAAYVDKHSTGIIDITLAAYDKRSKPASVELQHATGTKAADVA